MLHGKAMLRSFEMLGRVRTLGALRPGMRVARGFADIGYEEFIVLPNEQLLSLLTGEAAPIDASKREHLFEILSADQLARVVRESGCEFGEICFVDGREWRVEVRSPDGEMVSARAASLDESFMRIALAVHKVAFEVEGRCLKTAMVNA